MSDFTPKDLSLVHMVRAPRAPIEGKPPLLLQLHGVGSNERDLFSFAELLDPRLLVLSLRAPLVRGPDSFAWFNVEFLPAGFKIDPEQLRASRDKIVQFISEAVQAYDADPERVYLLGFSQGAIMSLTTALSIPAPIAGLVPLSGRIPPEAHPWMAPKEELAGLPILMVHGTQDAVIPVSHARQAHELLQKLPVTLTYQEFEMAHEVTPRVLRIVLAWLTDRLDKPSWRRNDGTSS
ncbi:MAG TPA: phospholipase [Ktedonobacterales bacterium]|jgi:phospholipase/carboxylesterase